MFAQSWPEVNGGRGLFSVLYISTVSSHGFENQPIFDRQSVLELFVAQTAPGDQRSQWSGKPRSGSVFINRFHFTIERAHLPLGNFRSPLAQKVGAVSEPFLRLAGLSGFASDGRKIDGPDGDFVEHRLSDSR